MHKKLSKHFIYNWLKEDAFGEYLFHKGKSSTFAKVVLERVWTFFFYKKNWKRAKFLSSPFTAFFLEFSALRLRSRLLKLRPAPVCQVTKLNQKKVLAKAIFIFSNFSYRSYNPGKFSTTPKLLSQKSRSCNNRFLYNRRRLLKRASNYKFLLKKKRYHQRKLKWKLFFRTLRKHSFHHTKFRHPSFNTGTRSRSLTAVRKKNINTHFTFNRRTAGKSLNLSFKIDKICRSRRFFPFLKLVHYKPAVSVLKTQLLGALKRVFVKLSFLRGAFLFYKKRNLWRFNSLARATTPPPYTRIILAKRMSWARWSKGAFKFRGGYLWVAKNISKRKRFQLSPQFRFREAFSKRIYKVKRHEKKRLLKFRLVSYFGLSLNLSDFYKVRNYYYESKIFSLPSLSFLEFRLSTLLLRCGFFENGYTINSLLKRELFLVNGGVTKKNILVNVWDIVSLNKNIWWLVYARFLNFFVATGGAGSLKLNHNSRSSKSNFLKTFFVSNSLLRKKNWKTGREENKLKLTRFLNSKNFILASAPQYMEVSYRLLTFIVHKIVTRAQETTQFPNLRGLANLLSSKVIKTPFVRLNFTNSRLLAKLAIL